MLAGIQGSPPPSPGKMHAKRGKIGQKPQEAPMDKEYLRKLRTEKEAFRRWRTPNNLPVSEAAGKLERDSSSGTVVTGQAVMYTN